VQALHFGGCCLWTQGSCFLSAGVAAGCLNFEHCSFSEMGFDSNIVATDVRTLLLQQEPEKTGGRLLNCVMNHMCSKWKTAANSIPIWPHGIPPFFLGRCLFAAYWPRYIQTRGAENCQGLETPCKSDRHFFHGEFWDSRLRHRPIPEKLLTTSNVSISLKMKYILWIFRESRTPIVLCGT
jgi:hypothetical protein